MLCVLCWKFKKQLADLALMCLAMLSQLLSSLFQGLTRGLRCIMLGQSCCELLLKLLDKARTWTLGEYKLRVAVQVLQMQE